MRQNLVTMWEVDDVAELRQHLDKAGVVGPSEHPNVRSEDPRKVWNGWNTAIAFGYDAVGHILLVEQWHFASGSITLSVSIDGQTGRLGPDDFVLEKVVFPVSVYPARPLIRYPEHTPGWCDRPGEAFGGFDGTGR